jgi:Fe-S cluster biogenesis protein NfuA
VRGSCTGCGSAAATLRNGIERWIKAKVPGVTQVEAAE